jgi:RimJ/RimL family protein N-acetyltransferase
MTHTNALGQPIGAPLPDWTARTLPPRVAVEGRHIRLEPISAKRHGADLFEALSADPDGALWTHRLNGPYRSRGELEAWLTEIEARDDMIYVAYVDVRSGKALGNGAWMTMAPGVGSIEIGSIIFAPALQRTTAATEAIYLMAKTVFDLGYRRLEWTCDPVNAASMAAAERFGFSYEALFRQAYVAKGRNRDKACFAITDADWPALDAAFRTWLAPENFASDGQQTQSLRDLTASHIHSRSKSKPGVEVNALGQPVDKDVPGWAPPPRPMRAAMDGQYCRLEPLSPDHAEDMFAAHSTDTEGRMWTYLPEGPFETLDQFKPFVDGLVASEDPLHYAIVVDGRAVGSASYLRIDPDAGSIEVGYITYSPLLQRTRASTEAMLLMMQWAFEAGYRRYEWKCNALNVPSRRAAQRLGFSYEGVFRQMQIVKGANRDTAWFAAIDAEWPALISAFETWLSPSNFDADSQQIQRLGDLTGPILVATDPTLR